MEQLTRAKTPFTGRRVTSSMDLSGTKKELTSRNSASNIKEFATTRQRKDPGHMTVRDFIQNSFRSHRGQSQSHLKYHPTERALQVNNILWKQTSKKECFLDPIIKKESKKVDLGKYATHSSWGDSLKNGI